MKINKNYVLRNVADTWIVLPLAEESVNFTGMMTLNESGVMLWKRLEQGAEPEDLVSALTSVYNVSAEQAHRDVMEFTEKLISAGCIAQS